MPHNLFLLLLLVVAFAACDKGGPQDGEAVPVFVRAGTPDPPPPVILPFPFDVPAPADTVLEPADLVLVDDLFDDLLDPEDLSPVVHAQVQNQVQEDLHERADELKRDAEEVKVLLEKKKMQLGTQDFNKWRATRPSPKERPYTRKPPSLQDHLRKL